MLNYIIGGLIFAGIFIIPMVVIAIVDKIKKQSQ